MHARLQVFNFTSLTSKLVYSILFLFSSFFIFANEKKEGDFFIDKAMNLKLYENSEWQDILFYQRKYFTGKSGIIDDPTFYLAEDGRQNSKSEMIATIKSFFSDKQKDTAIQCMYPRRLKWLKEKLDTNDLKIPLRDCPKLNQWLQNVSPQGVALVYSSFYLNNPASMFGHTFLRIIDSNYSLTDFGVNFAANPDTNNMFLYAVKGLTGQFEGKFSLLPYSVKVQEYNNSESRDLYEYELNISPEQTLNMMLSLWEIGDHYIHYYYIDENCSYLLLALLDTANPDFHFHDKFMFLVNPADTLRIVEEYPNLFKKIYFRPSALHRFKERYSVLNTKEKELFAKIISSKSVENKSELSKESIARVFTAVSEYIDYNERIAGTGEAEKYPLLRQKILLARAELSIVSPPLDIKLNETETTENGVHSSRIGTSYNYSTSAKNTFNIEFRPVLHDIYSPEAGYSSEAQIEFAKTIVSYEEKSNSVYLNEFSLLNIISLPSISPPLYPLAWGVQAAIKKDEDCQNGLYSFHCERSFFSGSAGFSLQQKPVKFYFLPNLQLSYMDDFGFESLIGATSGILMNPTSKVTFSLSGEVLKRYSISQDIWRWHQTIQSTFSINLLKELESRTNLSYNFQTSNWNIGSGIYWYFY